MTCDLMLHNPFLLFWKQAILLSFNVQGQVIISLIQTTARNHIFDNAKTKHLAYLKRYIKVDIQTALNQYSIYFRPRERSGRYAIGSATIKPSKGL